MGWTWDPAKSAANLHKHRVSFELAALALDTDPASLSDPDPHPDGDRWTTLAMIGVTVLFVVHTDAEGLPGRLISARKATARERQRYEEG